MNKITNYMINRIPTGRAWKGTTTQAIFHAVGNQGVNYTKYVNRESSLYHNFAVNYYKAWQTVLELPNESNLDRRYLLVFNALTDEGGQSPNYVQEQLNLLGFDVDVTRNIDPIQDPRLFFQDYQGMRLSDTNAFLNSLLFLGSEGVTQPYTFCVNYIDEIKDFQYENKHFLTDLQKRWAFCFFVHKKGGAIQEKATIPKSQRDEFRRKILELKNFGSWAILNVDFV